MFFHSSAQLERSTAFESYVSNANMVLRNSEVARSLGDVAVELAKINTAAFLPNIRHSKIVTPRSHRDEFATAIIPIFDEEAGDIGSTIDAYSFSPPIFIMPKQDFYSSTYGIESDHSSLRDMIFAQDALREDDVRHAVFDEPTIAATFTRFSLVEPGQETGYWQFHRPIEYFKMDTMLRHPAEIGSLACHEHLHALDQYNNGPIVLTDEHEYATEFNAYGLERKILSYFDTPDTQHKELVWTIAQIQRDTMASGSRIASQEARQAYDAIIDKLTRGI